MEKEAIAVCGDTNRMEKIAIEMSYYFIESQYFILHLKSNYLRLIKIYMKKGVHIFLILSLTFQIKTYSQVWSELGGTNSLKANNQIKCIYSDPAGNIYAAGYFTNDSNNFYVAKYNGTSWSELGGFNAIHANASIMTMCGDASGNIYAAGGFLDSTGKEYVAKFNGTSWSELGGINGLMVPHGVS